MDIMAGIAVGVIVTTTIITGAAGDSALIAINRPVKSGPIFISIAAGA